MQTVGVTTIFKVPKGGEWTELLRLGTKQPAGGLHCPAGGVP